MKRRKKHKMAKKKREKEQPEQEMNSPENVAQGDELKEESGDTQAEEGAENTSEQPLSETEQVEQELEAAKRRATEATEQYLRLMAEFDNFRKRSRKEVETFREYASESVLTAILPVLDDFARTLEAMEKTDNLSSIKEGIKLVSDKLHKVLEKEGLNSIETAGAEFDSEYHDAIHSVEVPEEKKGKVLEEVEKGYRLKDKVIRYSKVIVGE